MRAFNFFTRSFAGNDTFEAFILGRSLTPDRHLP
jgi:hypothetical protein